MVVKIKNYLFLISVSIGFVIHAENMDNKVSFRYGFIGKKSTNLDSLFIVEDASTLHSGDQLRLNVDFEKGTFSYVIHHTSQNEYVLLYSSSSHIENDKNNAIFSSFNVDWSTLDNNIGEELFYLLSSKIRIISLEQYFKDYDQAKNKSKQRIGKKIARGLDSFQNEEDKKSSQLVQRLEKPVIGGVTYRGATESVIMEQSLTHNAIGNERAIAVIKINHE